MGLLEKATRRSAELAGLNEERLSSGQKKKILTNHSAS
jgi:hypothetical protein